MNARHPRSALLSSGPTGCSRYFSRSCSLRELELRERPFRVLVQRRHAQREPLDRAQRRQQRRQVAAVAASDDGDRVGIDVVLRREKVVGGEDVAQALLARDGLVLRLRLRVAAQVEREANAAEPRHVARPGEVLPLVAAPAVDEEHARKRAIRARSACRGCARPRLARRPVHRASACGSVNAYLVKRPTLSSTPEK